MAPAGENINASVVNATGFSMAISSSGELANCLPSVFFHEKLYQQLLPLCLKSILAYQPNA
jgi:hypothetical protein